MIKKNYNKWCRLLVRLLLMKRGMSSKLLILALFLLLWAAYSCSVWRAPINQKALLRKDISWEAIVWAIEMKNIVDICRSFEEHFDLPENSVSLTYTFSLNVLNANGIIKDWYSPEDITWARFLVTDVPWETGIVFKAYLENSSFVEIYQRHRRRYGKEFVLTTWNEPRVTTQKSELWIPPQFASDQHCNWLGKLFPCGGLNNNLNSMMNGLIFAYFTGMAYQVPEVPVRSEMCYALTPCASFNNSTSWFKKTKPFTYIWDLKHLERHTSWLGVKLEKNEPKCLSEQEHLNKQADWVFLNDANVIRKKYSACVGSIPRKHLFPVKHSSCYEGVVNYDCMFASFKPRDSKYWGLWSVIRNSFKFSKEILSYADEMVSYIGQPFSSLHLRIEKDVELGMAEAPNWDTFYLRLPIRFKKCNISTSEPVVVVTGLSPGDPKRARTIDALKDWRLIWPEDFEHIYRKLEDGGELERRAAIQYALCLRSTKHMGFFHSSFDVNLHVDRRLRDGHFSHNVFPIPTYEVKNLFKFFQKTVYPVLLTS